jgi:hypothetical protein
MFIEQLRRAVEASPRAELPTVSGLLWKAFAAGHVSEAEASALSEAIELRKAIPAAQKPAQRRLGSRPRSETPAWSAAAAGPPLEPCRRRSRPGSRWPSNLCSPSCPPRFAAMPRARSRLATLLPWPGCAVRPCAMPCERRSSSALCMSNNGGFRLGGTALIG